MQIRPALSFPLFLLSGVEKFPNLHFFGRNFSRLAKNCNFLGKIANLRGLKYQNWHFLGKVSPTQILSHPPILFGRIFTYGCWYGMRYENITFQKKLW